MTTIEMNKRLIETYFNEVWNKGNIDLLDELVTPGYINHSSSMPDNPPGPEGLKPIVMAMRQAFPDLHYTIEDLVITDSKVVARVMMTGTQTGDFFGLLPTGNTIKVRQVNMEYIQNGKIAEHWRLTDELLLMKQLGLVQ